jgi:protein ImuB
MKHRRHGLHRVPTQSGNPDGVRSSILGPQPPSGGPDRPGGGDRPGSRAQGGTEPAPMPAPPDPIAASAAAAAPPSTRPAAAARWLALHLPQLPLEAFCATLAPADAARPVALLRDHQVQQLNAAAVRAGVRQGMRRATALALAHDLLPVAMDPVRDAAALQAVVHAALAFTPAVTLDTAPDGAPTVLLEVQASLRLFGGWPRLLQRLAQALAPLGHQLQCAAAPTPLGAAVLARAVAEPQPAEGLALPAPLLHGPHLQQPARLVALLDRLPPWVLPAGAAQQPALQAMGLQTLGALRRLPRDGLARRFGPALLADWDRAGGRGPDPRVPLQAPEAFEDRLELHARAEHTEPLLAAAAVLLARLVVWAQARQVRLCAFTLRLLHERTLRSDDAPRPPTALRVALAEPSLDPAHLQTLLRERLGRCRLSASVVEVHLHCREVASGAAPSGELFPTRQTQAEGLLRLLERLRARLGDAAVVQIEPRADHRPEQAQHEVPVRTLPPAPPCPPPVPGRPWTQPLPPLPALPLHRPAWLLPDPLPLAERDGLPCLEGRPLRLLLGPERIETGWWDDAPALRDYYVATLADAADRRHGSDGSDGALLWVWRSRLPDAQGRMPWFLQGRFG